MEIGRPLGVTGGKYGALCSVCDWKLKNCNKSALLKHKVSAKHVKCLEVKKRTINIQQFFKKPTESEKFQDKVAKAELLLDGYVAEHGVPLVQVNHLVEVIKICSLIVRLLKA